MSSEGSIGGSIDGTDMSSDLSGAIYGLSIGRLSIGGSIIAGTDTSTNGNLTRNGAIIAVKDLGTIAVKGSLIGNVTPNGVPRVLITVVGQAPPSATLDLAIGKLSIGGRVEHAQILAGFDSSVSSTPAPTNSNASIGAITVGSDWRASSVSAGIQDTSANGFGNADDAVIAQPPADAILSRIASVTIKGLILGTPAMGDHYGFTAQQIGSFSVKGTKLSLTTNTDAPIPLAPLTSDVFLREV